MSELPWYAWLNLIGLMLLWIFYGFGDMLQKSGRLVKAGHHLVIVVAVLFVSGLWQHLQTPGTSGLLVALAVFMLAATAWEMLGGIYLLVTEGAKAKSQPPQTSELVAVPAVTDDGALDLDAGTMHSAENREKLNSAIKDVFSSDSAGGDRLKGIGTLLSLGDEADEAESAVESALYGLAGIAIVGAILLLPCLLAWRVTPFSQ